MKERGSGHDRNQKSGLAVLARLRAHGEQRGKPGPRYGQWTLRRMSWPGASLFLVFRANGVRAPRGLCVEARRRLFPREGRPQPQHTHGVLALTRAV